MISPLFILRFSCVDTPTCSNTSIQKLKNKATVPKTTTNILWNRNFFTLNSLFITLMYSCAMVHISNGYPIDHSRPDLLCNEESEFECVCNRSIGNLDTFYKPCEEFMDTQSLQAISMIMKKVNLNARLYNNETYQQYFRRRIANIVSRYCEQQPQECPGIENKNEQLSEENDKDLKFSAKFLLDEEDPLFDENNVIILQVNFLPSDRIELFYVVTKNIDGIKKLNSDVIMDSDPIKYILTAQLAPLSRVLGGIRIEQLKTVEFTKQHVLMADNQKLILIVVGILFAIFICYLLACIVTIRHCKQRKRRKRNMGFSTNGTNYGSCTDKLIPKFDVSNGKHKSSKSITSRESLNFKKKKVSSETSPIEPQTPNITKLENEDSGSEEKTIDARSFARMFACDFSQLPPEIDVYDDEEQVPEESRPHSDTDASVQLRSTEETLPSVVLAPSTSHSDNLHTTTTNELKQFGAFLAANEFVSFERPTSRLGNRKDIAFDRPLSRRGSRSSTPEQGVEETDTREDTPLPLGDDQNQEEESMNELLPIPDIIVKSNTAHQFDHWSSDSEPEQSELYKPLDEASDDEKAPTHEKILIEDKNKNLRKIKKISSENSANSDSENSDEEQDEIAMLDRHNYERLQESPIPQTTLFQEQSSIEIDSTLPYKLQKETSQQNGNVKKYYYTSE